LDRCHDDVAIKLDDWPNVPRIFIDLPLEAIKAESDARIRAQAVVLTVQREDGKEARFHLSLAVDPNGRLKAELLSMRKEDSADETPDVSRIVCGYFRDYS
jgi:hypothetical protein